MTQSLTKLSLEQLLAQQITVLTQLIDLQDQEKTILEKRDAPQLEELTHQKTQYLNQLEKTDQTLARHADVASVSKQYPEQLHTIQTLLARVQQQNEVNGQIVRLTLGRVQTLKHQLQSMKGESALTYNEKGKTQGGLSSRGIKA